MERTKTVAPHLQPWARCWRSSLHRVVRLQWMVETLAHHSIVVVVVVVVLVVVAGIENQVER